MLIRDALRQRRARRGRPFFPAIARVVTRCTGHAPWLTWATEEEWVACLDALRADIVRVWEVVSCGKGRQTVEEYDGGRLWTDRVPPVGAVVTTFDCGTAMVLREHRESMLAGNAAAGVG